MSFYDRMSKEACTSLKFSKIGRLRTNMLKNENKFPNFSKTSVGFHVRRGDKILNEAVEWKGNHYVDKLLNVITTPIDKCFVASDDYRAVLEIKQSLQDNNVGCKIYTLVEPKQKGSFQGDRSDEEVLQLITEISILSEVTYFIGTSSSNVGTLVSLLRSCGKKDKNYYFQSHGVDDEVHWK